MVRLSRRSLVGGAAGLGGIALFGKYALAQPEGIPEGTQKAKFVDAVDGEKLKVSIDGEEHEVRLIGVDAPEEKNDDDQPECYFEESRSRLKEMLNGRTIYLESDAEDKDNKDRLWRFVWYNSESAGESYLVNEKLLQEGTVILREEEKNTKYHDRLQEAGKQAEKDKVGLWDACGGGHVAVTPIPRHGSKDDPGMLGERLEASGMAVTLQSAYTTYEYGYSTPRGGYKFLVVEVYLENISSETKGYGDDRIKVKDNDSGAEFKDTYRPTDQPLANGELSPRSYIYGIVGIEVQETSSNLRVEYKVNAIGGDIAYWNIVV